MAYATKITILKDINLTLKDYYTESRKNSGNLIGFTTIALTTYLFILGYALVDYIKFSNKVVKNYFNSSITLIKDINMIIVIIISVTIIIIFLNFIFMYINVFELIFIDSKITMSDYIKDDKYKNISTEEYFKSIIEVKQKSIIKISKILMILKYSMFLQFLLLGLLLAEFSYMKSIVL